MPVRSWIRRLWTRPVTAHTHFSSQFGRNLEALEDRVVPAYDLHITFASSTSNVTASTNAGTTTFEATGPGATLNFIDVTNELQAGLNVIVTTGSGGNEAGNITRGYEFAVGGTFPSGTTLSFRTGSGPNLVGNMDLPGLVPDAGALNLDVQAAGSVQFGGSFGKAALPLQAITLSSTNGSITSVNPTLFGSTLTATAATGVNLTTAVGSLEARTATGGVTVRNTGNLAVGGITAGLSGVDVTTSGTVDVQTTGTLTVNSSGDDITTASGNIVLTADDVVLGQAVNAGSGTVTLRPASTGREINLGTNVSGTLGITQAELNQITAGTVVVGRNDIATGTVAVSAAVGVTGSRNLTVTTARDIDIRSGVTLSTVDGDLTLSANQQAAPTSGTFIGIDLFGGTVTATGTGSVTLRGRGGDTGDFNVGVRIVGDVSGRSTTVVGTGGLSSGVANYGIDHQNGKTITSTGGTVTVTGIGGGTGAGSSQNVGIKLGFGAKITAGGTGTVNATFVGGNAGSTASGNFGLWMVDSGTAAEITSNGGAVNVTATGTISSEAISLSNNSVISSGNNAPITVTTDSLSLSGAARIDAGTGTTTIQPRTTGIRINLGGADVLSGSPLVLGLTDAELDRITAGKLVVGRNDIAVGRIDVSAAVGPANSATVSLITPENISGAGTLAATNLALRAATGINLSGANAVSKVALVNTSSGTVAFNSSANLLVATVDGLTGAKNAANLTLSTSTGADLTTAAGLDGVSSSIGTLTLNAGQDLFLGNGSNFGDVTGSVLSLSAGRDIIASNITYAQGSTNVTATAGRDITIQGNSLINSTGSGAPVSLTTGTGGVLTINNSIAGRGSATSDGGTLTVTADDLVLTSGGLDSNGTVIVRPVSAGRGIDLGTNSVGKLSITQAELDRIAAATLTIGRNDIGTGNVTVSSAISRTNSTTLGILTARSIIVNANLTGGSGGLTLSANQQATPTAAVFAGVQVDGATVDGGTGTLTVLGKSGSSAGSFQYGVQVLNAGKITSSGGNVSVTGTSLGTGGAGIGVRVEGAGQITAGGNGTVTVMGQGNLTSTSNSNIGVLVTDANSRITSTNGNVSVTGFGGGVGSGTFDAGVQIQSGGEISAGGAGTVEVIGVGGNSDASSNSNNGVVVLNSGSQITSGGGSVTVTGTGGGTGSGGGNRGVILSGGGKITAGGMGAVNVIGFGSTTSTGTSNSGVHLEGTDSIITSNGGPISIQGTAGTGPGAFGVTLFNNTSITSVGSASITVTSDSLNIASTAAIDGLANTVTIRPMTAGTHIDLGGSDVTFGSPLTLGLTDTELDRITAGTLVIGRNDIATATVTVSAAVSPANTTTLSLVTPANITGSGSITETNLALRASTGINLPGANAVIQLVASNSTSGGITFNNTASNLTLANTTINGVNGISASGQALIFSTTTSGNIAVNTAISGTTISLNSAGSLDSNAQGTLSGSTSVTLANSGTTSSLAGIISGGNLTYNGPGTLTLTASNTFAGTTSVSGGTLLVDGTNSGTGPVAVQSGGTLGGTGTIAGVVTLSADGQVTGGTLGGVGTLTVGGLLFDGGTLAADFDGDTSDTVATAGTVDLADPGQGIFSKNSQNGTATAGTVFTLIDLTGSGSISNVPLANAAAGATDTINGKSGVFGYTGGPGGNDFVFVVSGNEGVVVTQPGGTTVVTENGPGETFTLELASQPVADVTITLSGTGVDFDDNVLVFTSTNWNIAQTVTVTAIDNFIVDGIHAGQVAFAVTSVDGNYNGLSVAPLSVTINDDDTPASVELSSGNDQSSVIGNSFGDPLAVLVRNMAGQPVSGATVTYIVPPSEPSAVVSTSTALSGAGGIASVIATAGNLVGTYTVTANVAGAGAVSFTLTNLAQSQVITFPPPAVVPFSAVAVANLTATASSGLPVTYVVVSGPGELVGGSVVRATGPGAVVVRATQPGDTMFGAAEPVEVAIVFRPVGSSAFPLFTTSGDQVGVSVQQPGEPANEVPGTGPGSRAVVADVTGDGVADTILASAPGARVTVTLLDGVTGNVIRTLGAFEDTFRDSATLAAGDVNGDGIADIAVGADAFGGPRVTVFDGATGSVLADFYGIDDPDFRGGVRVALGDVDGDGLADLAVAAGVGGGPRIALWDGASLRPGSTPTRLVDDFFCFEPTLRDGANVTLGDVNGDGKADLVLSGGPGGSPRVLVWDAADFLASNGTARTVLANFFAGDESLTLGARVAAKDLDGDLFADLVVGIPTGPATSLVRTYLGKDLSPTGTPRAFTEEMLDFGGVFVG